MNVLLFGATGMVGQGVLRECLLDPGVTRVQVIGRTPTGVSHPIQPLHGARSKTPAYRVIYTAAKPVMTLLRRAFPNHVLTTEEIGLAMLAVARYGYATPILEVRDIRAVLNLN